MKNLSLYSYSYSPNLRRAVLWYKNKNIYVPFVEMQRGFLFYGCGEIGKRNRLKICTGTSSILVTHTWSVKSSGTTAVC